MPNVEYGTYTFTCQPWRPQLKLDISSLVDQQARVLELGVGFEYWRNVFGKGADRVPGAKQFTPVVTLAVHLPLGSSRH